MSEQIPMTGLKNCVWTLEYRQTEQFSRGGGSQSIKLGDPFWRVKFEFENMREADFRALTAFIARRDGSRVTFFAHRPDRPHPINSDDNITVTAYAGATTNATITLSNGDDLAPGDMFAYDAPNGRYVGEVTAITASIGNSHSVLAVPPPLAAAGTHNCTVVNAFGEFTLEPDSLNISEPFDITKRVSFTARQVEP